MFLEKFPRNAPNLPCSQIPSAWEHLCRQGQDVQHPQSVWYDRCGNHALHNRSSRTWSHPMASSSQNTLALPSFLIG